MEKKAVCINAFHEYEYDNRTSIIEEFLHQKGYACTYLTSDFSHRKKEKFHVDIENCIQIPTKPYKKNLSAERLLSHYCFARDAFKLVEKINPDLVYMVVPVNSLVAQAAKYKSKKPHVQIVFDILDLWPETFPNNSVKKLLAYPFGKWASMRNDGLSVANMVVTECSLFQDVLRPYCCEERLKTLYLASNSRPLSAENNAPEEKIALCYLGSINHIIDIPCITQIIRKIDMPVELHIVGDGEKRQELIDAATSAGAEVIFHGKIFDSVEKQKVFDCCHYGLNIMKDSVCVGLTLKSVDYFLGGLPIINNIKGDTWSLVENECVGVNYSVNTPLSAKELLQNMPERAHVQTFFSKYFSREAFLHNLETIFAFLWTLE